MTRREALTGLGVVLLGAVIGIALGALANLAHYLNSHRP